MGLLRRAEDGRLQHETMLALKERLREFRRELLQLAEQHGQPERVAQINLQLFPLSQRPEGEDEGA